MDSSNGTRLCKVGDRLGYFNTWEHYSKPVPASLMIGGAPAGVFSQIFGIVEFPDGTERVEPHKIKFCDEQNAALIEMTKRQIGRK